MDRKTSPNPEVLCFGEALWDCLPHGLFCGGSPLNAAVHLHRLGSRALLVSAVGGDFLGEELLLRLREAGMDVSQVRRHSRLPTGTARLRLDRKGEADFTIAEPAAWDRLTIAEPLIRRASGGACLLHGSLALRGQTNRRALAKLAGLPGIKRIFDVNLRAPHDNPILVAQWARGVDLIKVNREELQRLAPAASRGHTLEQTARALAAEWQTPRLCVTLDADGAALLDGDRWHREPGRKVRVKDTVGAGDAFLAALIHHWMLGGADPADALAIACRLGEYVATRDGATPGFDPKRFS